MAVSLPEGKRIPISVLREEYFNQCASHGRYIARISLTASSMNLTSTGLAAGPPAK